MDFLICDEVWQDCHSDSETPECEDDNSYKCCTNYEEVFKNFVAKESSYMPVPGYVDLLHSRNLILPRLKAIQWFIKTRSRLNLSIETVFNAANYLDRFVSTNHCNGSENWMIELLSVACLSVASKFSESSPPSLQQIQMEGLDHLFQSSKITQMEFILLEALRWRLVSTTCYSLAELLLPWKIELFTKLNSYDNINARVIDFLLGALLDFKFLEYRPSVVAMSALWCGVEELMTTPLTSSIYFSYTTDLNIEQDQMEELKKCHGLMMEIGSSVLRRLSPMSVLSMQHGSEVCDCKSHLLFCSTDSHIVPSKKRKRGSTEIS